MHIYPDILIMIWEKLLWPMIRLVTSISLGLLVANFIEALNWTRGIATFARPLARLGNMSDTTGASFSMAIFSGLAANTLLAEAYDKNQIQKKELIVANLFNSLPTYFVHLPTVFFITVPLIKSTAFIYVGMTTIAALLRTLVIVVVSRFILPMPEKALTTDGDKQAVTGIDWHGAVRKTLLRFKKRIRKILLITVPIYIVVYAMHRFGIFSDLEQAAASYMTFIPWLSPKSMGIITLGLTAEITAGVAAAGAIIQEGTLPTREIILALIIGNILSSPLRAVRHQFPYYAGIFRPKMATLLIFYSQVFRIASLIFVAVIYYYWTL
jgi:hypothetical protein